MTQLLLGLAVFVIVATSAATVAALLARTNWFFDLFSNFPVQYAVLLALSAAVCLVLRQWGWTALAVFALVPNVIAIAPYLSGIIRPAAAVARQSGTEPVLLVSLNLLYTQEDAAATRDYLEARSADILVLSELTPRWHEKLEDLERLYPHAVIRPRWDPWGLAIYSRYPLVAIEDLDLGDQSSAHLRVLVQLPTGLLEVYGVHLASPPTPRDAARRDRQFARLAARVKAAEAADPTLARIVVGDLNATPWTPSFRDFLRDTGLVDARRPFGLHVTWPYRPPLWSVPFRIPIDHCLASPGLEVTSVDTGPAVGSDHLPLECRIGPTG